MDVTAARALQLTKNGVAEAGPSSRPTARVLFLAGPTRGSRHTTTARSSSCRPRAARPRHLTAEVPARVDTPPGRKDGAVDLLPRQHGRAQ